MTREWHGDRLLTPLPPRTVCLSPHPHPVPTPFSTCSPHPHPDPAWKESNCRISDWPHTDTLLMWLQLFSRVSDSGKGVSCCGVSGRDTTAQDTADFQLNFRAVSCCFIRERLSTSVAFMAFISRGITAESETHYRGITALFSWFVPIPAVTTVVTAALLWLQSPCHPLLVTVSQYPGCGHSLACGECDRDLKGFS